MGRLAAGQQPVACADCHTKSRQNQGFMVIAPLGNRKQDMEEW
jgi:hypothetical protein